LSISIFFAAVVFGGPTIETFVPGQSQAKACYSTLTATGLPPLTYPVTYYDAAAITLYVCGINIVTYKFECYFLTSVATAWAKRVFSTSASVSIPFVSFAYNKQLWIVSDSSPKVFHLASGQVQNFWDTAANPPTNLVYRTNGQGCAVVVGDFVYFFGGLNSIAVLQMYLKGLGIAAALPAIPDGTRKWEYLGNMPTATVRVVSGSCASLPSNRNLILIEDIVNSVAYTYDISMNTFTKVATSINFQNGIPLNELCHDNTLYAFPDGTKAKTYSPALTLGTNWPDSPSAGSLAASRTNPIVVVVSKAFLGASTNCTGC
jgi:hypothetical protein